MWKRCFDYSPLLAGRVIPGDGCEAVSRDHWLSTESHPWLSGVSFYVPDSYTETYAYPLICYLHDNGRSERDLWRWFPKISDQNFLAMSVRAPFRDRSPLTGRFCWRGQRPDASLGVLRDAIQEMESEWNVHPDRIILFGEGTGAVIAMQLSLLMQSGSLQNDFEIAGVVCGSQPSWWPHLLPPVEEELTGRCLLLNQPEEGEAMAAIDALGEAGLSLTLASEDCTPAAAINRWVMSGIATTIG
jgi:poly(3-hydroxybutyrate) depolymerase